MWGCAKQACAGRPTFTLLCHCAQIDTGTDLMHPDIQDNLWINPQEKAAKGASFTDNYMNGADDDGNGGCAVISAA